MKPLKLSMQAFTSYGRKTVIDFTLPRQNLFLISGDTGSGKTSIFDAIVFALFGEASSDSNKKEGTVLQSQFVPLDVEPFVELEFSQELGGEAQCFTVHRVPGHYRNYKRGSGSKKENSSVSLTLPDGSIFPGGIKETDEKIQEIIGLSKAQFMQVAMIAQGEFLQLLRENTKNKKEIFRRLFNTGLYQKITDELNERRRAKEEEIKRIQTELRSAVAHIMPPDNYLRREQVLELKDRISSAEKPNVVDMENLLEELRALCAEIEKSLRQLEQAKSGAAKLKEEKQKAFTRGETLSKSFEQLDKAEKTIADCMLREEEIRKARELKRQISAAYEIEGRYKIMAEAEKKLNNSLEELNKLQQALPGLIMAEEEAEKLQSQARERKDRELGDYSKLEEQVKKAIALFGDIENAEKELVSAEKDRAGAEKNREKAREALSDFEKEYKRRIKRREELSKANELLQAWEFDFRRLTELLKALDELKQSEKDIIEQDKKALAAAEAYKKAKFAYENKEREYNQVYTAFLDAQAGLIAREMLREGSPCPVCGSLQHPEPCALSSEHSGLSRETVEKLSEEKARLSGEQSEASLASGREAESLGFKKEYSEKLLNSLRERLSEEKLGEAQSREEIENILFKRKRELSGQEAQLKENADKLNELTEKLQGAEAERSDLNDKLAQREKELSDKTALCREIEVRLEELNKNKSYDSREEAQSLLAEAKKRLKQALNADTEAAESLKKAGEEASGCSTRISGIKEKLPELEQELSVKKQDYSQLLQEKEMDEQSWQAVCGRHKKEEILGLEKKIEDFQRTLSEAQGGKAAALSAVGHSPRPDIQKLSKELQQAEEALNQLEGQFILVSGLMQPNSTALGDLAPKMQEREQIAGEYSVIQSLYSRLAGRVSGGRMDIESFAQRWYLQQALYAANLRFSQMSAGQFELRMVKEEDAGEGKANQALDLMVYSTVTGKEREVRTLSGGESFMAALSLALGMADQIQENSSAIKLDMMFIDEGFGSLDSHSRQQAVKVLKQMAGGQKLIGIISHVSELKQEIEDQLLVTKDENGSHCSWLLS